LRRARADLDPDRLVQPREVCLADALVAETRVALGARLLAPDRADVAGVGGQRALERGHVELEVVGHHADGRTRVDRRLLEEAVGPLERELVGVREALARHERRARVADGDAVAEKLAHRHERGDVVARAEDVEIRPWRVRADEDELALAGLDYGALADLEQRA